MSCMRETDAWDVLRASTSSAMSRECSALRKRSFGSVDRAAVMAFPSSHPRPARRSARPSVLVMQPHRSADVRVDRRSSRADLSSSIRRFLRSGLSCEGPEAIPDRHLERVAEFVAAGPPLDVDQLTPVEPTQHDPVDLTTAAGAAAEMEPMRSSRLESGHADSLDTSSYRPRRSRA